MKTRRFLEKDVSNDVDKHLCQNSNYNPFNAYHDLYLITSDVVYIPTYTYMYIHICTVLHIHMNKHISIYIQTVCTVYTV